MIGYTFALLRIAFGDAPCIVFQLEPSGDYSGNALPKDCENFEILRGAKQIWDYSPLNIQYLSEQGLTNVRYIPVGYSRRLQKVDDKVVQDLDVLCFGATSPRRVEILEALRARNINTGVLFAGTARIGMPTRARQDPAQPPQEKPCPPRSESLREAGQMKTRGLPPRVQVISVPARN